MGAPALSSRAMVDEDKDSPELQVARLFRLAGHEVTQSVGEEPGAVDWFATPREGFVRPRTYWRAWKTWPDRLDEALSELEQARIARHADRALGVVMEGRPPGGYRSDLASGTTNAVTYRELLLALAGITEQVREYVKEHERQGTNRMYLPRRAHVKPGGDADAIALIEEWVASGQRSHLTICGALFSGRGSVVDEAIYRIGRQFITDPTSVTPIVWPQDKDGELAHETYSLGWAIPVREHTSSESQAARSAQKGVTSAPDRRTLFISDGTGPDEYISINLLPVESHEIEAWFRERVDAEDVYGCFIEARGRNPAFKHMSDSLPNMGLFLGVLRAKEAAVPSALSGWMARIVVAYFDTVQNANPGEDIRKVFDLFGRAAVEKFGLGRSRSLQDAESREIDRTIAAAISTWTTPPIDLWRPDRYRWATDSSGDDSERIDNPLILHYFLACKIAGEVRAGNLDILTRYQFPSEYVLLFLAILAPDVAAQATAERGEAIRAEIDTEVERRLQLTLAHALKRSAGAVRSHMKTIQRHVDRATPGALEHEFTRVEEEVAFQCALAEQTRLWHEVPESEVEGLTLESYLTAVATDLRAAYPQVAYETSVDRALRVRATREVLREILHCLLENAFQAVAFAGDLAKPRVRVDAHLEGGTIRLDVLDSGPGVAPGDRERIFDLYVTTKKGGPNKPLGTGMGLPIARRYAEHVGGQVGLDPAREETCFFVRFVAWRHIG